MKCQRGVSSKACEKFMEVRKKNLPTSDKVPVILFGTKDDRSATIGLQKDRCLPKRLHAVP